MNINIIIPCIVKSMKKDIKLFLGGTILQGEGRGVG